MSSSRYLYALHDALNQFHFPLSVEVIVFVTVQSSTHTIQGPGSRSTVYDGSAVLMQKSVPQSNEADMAVSDSVSGLHFLPFFLILHLQHLLEAIHIFNAAYSITDSFVHKSFYDWPIVKGKLTGVLLHSAQLQSRSDGAFIV